MNEFKDETNIIERRNKTSCVTGGSIIVNTMTFNSHIVMQLMIP